MDLVALVEWQRRGAVCKAGTNHSSFRAFCFHRSKVLLTGCYVGSPQPIVSIVIMQ